MSVRRARVGVAAIALACSASFDAAETSDIEVHESHARGSERRAAVWNLSRADWTRYEELMARPSIPIPLWH